MKIIIEDQTLFGFQTWAGATETKNAILKADKGHHFELLIEELYPEGLTDVQLNDILWHEWDYIFEQLGITE
jgi:hypothetical protein